MSRVAQSLDAAVAAFHARRLGDRYKALMLDGVVLARKTGAGALRRPVLVALGLRPDGKKEVIDFRLARGESAAEWERFLDDLYKRGLTGEGLDMICVDGAQAPGRPAHGLRQNPRPALLAHKIRNILNKSEKPTYRCQGRPARRDERRRRLKGALGQPPFATLARPIPPPSPACATISTNS